ncbi:MAG TPA: hypothetical protein V6C97_01020, partial [Oculatellaceae cyanobacterium]
QDGCLPYPLPPCEHHVNGSLPSCAGTYLPTPVCTRRCQSSGTTHPLTLFVYAFLVNQRTENHREGMKRKLG